MSDYPIPETSPETKSFMASMKLHEYKGRKVPNWTNPDSWWYWGPNIVLTGVLLVLRYQCQLIKGPRSMLTIPIVLIPVARAVERRTMALSFC